jgi:hypothetical protein
MFGTIGVTIEETTEHITYDKIVSIQDYMKGIRDISINHIVQRVWWTLIVRILITSFIYFLILFSFGPKLSYRTTLIIVVLLMLIQTQFMFMPFVGIILVVGSPDMINGIDGEIFGEEWFSWAASDLFIIVTIIFGYLLVRQKKLPNQ